MAQGPVRIVNTMSHRSFRRNERGVTLLEAVVVMTIVGILAAIAIPAFTYVSNANRIAAEVNGLLGDMQFARAEAVKEGQTVTVCVSTNGTSCSANNTNWQNGWIVFSDVNGNQQVDNGTDTVLRVQSVFTSSDTFVANNNVAAVTFNREGFATGGGIANGAMIALHAKVPTNASTRCLSVTLVGLVSVVNYDGATCL